MLNELSLAKKMVEDGIKKPLPVPGTNYILIALRITGTGYAYRSKSKSFVFRDPADFLTDNVLDMCNGLPVIIEHEGDKKGINGDTETIGTVFYPYIKGSEVWGIAKIWKLEALENIIDDERISTSPSFVCQTKLLKESPDLVRQDLTPISCNHIAILPNGLMGVWDKYDPESQAIHLFNDSQEVETMPDPIEGAVPENGGGEPATLEKILQVAQQALDGLTALSARVEAIEAAEKTEPAHAPVAEPVAEASPKMDAAEAVVEPEIAAKTDEPTNAEIMAKLDAMNAGGFGDDEAQEKAELLDDAETLFYRFRKPKVGTHSGETATAYRRRMFKESISILKDLNVPAPFNDSTAALIDESLRSKNPETVEKAKAMLKSVYDETKKVVFGIQPKALDGHQGIYYEQKKHPETGAVTRIPHGNIWDYISPHIANPTVLGFKKSNVGGH